MKFITYSLSQQEKIEHCADGNKHYQGQHQILLDTTGLDSSQFSAKPISHVCGAIAKEAIDDRQIEIITDKCTQTLCCWTKDMQDAINDSLIYKLVNNIFRKPVGRFDKNMIIEFIEVILVLEERDLPPIFCRRIDIAIRDPSQIKTAQRDNE